MVSEIFPVVASDEYAEKILSPTSLHKSITGPSPSIISNRQLASSTIVKYTLDIYYSQNHQLSRPTNY